MKFFLAICSFALVAQVSIAHTNQEAYDVLMENAKVMKSMAETFIKEAPGTGYYPQYKENFEYILNDFNKENEPCLRKTKMFTAEFGGIRSQMKFFQSGMARKFNEIMEGKGLKLQKPLPFSEEPTAAELDEVC